MASGSVLGQRVALYRRRAGFSNTQALATFINSPQISDSVLRNIESGRKADVSATQLVEIALALGVPLAFLLAPMETPLAPVDMPNVSDRISSMPAWEFDARLSASGPDFSWWPASHAPAWRHLQALRLVLRDLALLEDLEAQERSGSASQEEPRSLDHTRSQLRFLTDRHTTALAEYQDVSWVPRPWLPDTTEAGPPSRGTPRLRPDMTLEHRDEWPTDAPPADEDRYF